MCGAVSDRLICRRERPRSCWIERGARRPSLPYSCPHSTPVCRFQVRRGTSVDARANTACICLSCAPAIESKLAGNQTLVAPARCRRYQQHGLDDHFDFSSHPIHYGASSCLLSDRCIARCSGGAGLVLFHRALCPAPVGRERKDFRPLRPGHSHSCPPSRPQISTTCFLLRGM